LEASLCLPEGVGSIYTVAIQGNKMEIPASWGEI
jgi:hypothetical protein